MNQINWLKYHLSHIKENSWHYKLVESMWSNTRYNPGKACTYYWIKIPASLIGMGAFFLSAGIIVVVMVLFGYIPTIFDQTTHSGLTYGYKRLPNNKRIPIALWEVILSGFILFMLYFEIAIDSTIFWTIVEWFRDRLSWILTGIVGVVLLSVVGWIVSRPMLRSGISTVWSKICPDLVIEKEESTTG